MPIHTTIVIPAATVVVRYALKLKCLKERFKAGNIQISWTVKYIVTPFQLYNYAMDIDNLSCNGAVLSNTLRYSSVVPHSTARWRCEHSPGLSRTQCQPCGRRTARPVRLHPAPNHVLEQEVNSGSPHPRPRPDSCHHVLLAGGNHLQALPPQVGEPDQPQRGCHRHPGPGGEH